MIHELYIYKKNNVNKGCLWKEDVRNPFECILWIESITFVAGKNEKKQSPQTCELTAPAQSHPGRWTRQPLESFGLPLSAWTANSSLILGVNAISAK